MNNTYIILQYIYLICTNSIYNDNKPPNVVIQNVENPDDVLDDTVKTLDGTQNEENIVDNNTTNNEETNDTVVEEGQGENLDGGDQVE